MMFTLAIPVTSLPQLILEYFCPGQVLTGSILVPFRGTDSYCKINKNLDIILLSIYLVHLSFFSLSIQDVLFKKLNISPQNVQHLPVGKHNTVLGGPAVVAKYH